MMGWESREIQRLARSPIFKGWTHLHRFFFFVFTRKSLKILLLYVEGGKFKFSLKIPKTFCFSMPTYKWDKTYLTTNI